jgi:hypothetical protein
MAKLQGDFLGGLSLKWERQKDSSENDLQYTTALHDFLLSFGFYGPGW